MSHYKADREAVIKKISAEIGICEADAEAKLAVLEKLGEDYAQYIDAWFNGAPANGEANGVTVFEIIDRLCIHYLDAVIMFEYISKNPERIKQFKLGMFSRG